MDLRVWAPKRQRVDAATFSAGHSSLRSTQLRRDADGYFSGLIPDLPAGSRYGLRLDNGDKLFPDPASRFQPDGPDGLSAVIDPETFDWTDQAWKGVNVRGAVVYEMHLGTFTSAGTWKAASAELPGLARAGMTILEVMPVADFPGEFGWGYDGVCHFAPTRLYGTPDDFRRFVDQAHASGLGVILDVVYNHFGTQSNWLPEFADEYVATRHQIEWGDGINFDGPGSGAVREYFLSNVRYWIEEFHLDGFRFDAAQFILDDSTPHVLTEMVQAARESAGDRTLFLVAENERQNVRLVQPVEHGGHGLDAVWTEDFHHTARVRLTGRNEAYFSDFLGTPEELIGAVRHSFLYQGQRSEWQKSPRGTPTRGVAAGAFVSFLQNHDQIANTGRGARLTELTSPGRLRAMTALWLLAPQTPLFFQGQEFQASAPFLYFADRTGNSARRTSEGRRQFLNQFPSLATEEGKALLLEPHERSVFERCRLNHAERELHAAAAALHRDLLRLRRDDPVFGAQRSDLLEGAALSDDALVLRFFQEDDDRLLLVNFGRDLRLSPVPQPLLAPPGGRGWTLLWSSESPVYGGQGTPPIETESGWRVPGESAVVLRAISVEHVGASASPVD